MAKKTNRQIIVHKTQHRTLKTKQHEPSPKPGGDSRCSGRVSRSCSTYGTRRVAAHWNNKHPTDKIKVNRYFFNLFLYIKLIYTHKNNKRTHSNISQ